MRWFGLSLLAAGTLLAQPAAAQLATSSNAPVDITADELETANGACTSIWRGHAEALQETSRLRADVLTIDFERKDPNKTGACGDVTHMRAEGSVFYVTPTQKVRGDLAVYEAASNTLTVTGDVVATQGQNVLRGTKMVFNTETGQGRMVGAAAGGKSNRPRGVFYPRKSTTTSAQNSATTQAH
jgi:lipopolysaccharide export system protein LptA